MQLTRQVLQMGRVITGVGRLFRGSEGLFVRLMGERLGGRDGFPPPGGAKRRLAENPKVLPGGLGGGDGCGSWMGNEGAGG